MVYISLTITHIHYKLHFFTLWTSVGSCLVLHQHVILTCGYSSCLLYLCCVHILIAYLNVQTAELENGRSSGWI